jgi:nitroreductase
MDVEQAIKERTSIRAFKPDPISDSLIKELIELACQAPCAGNIQEWLFVIVRDRKIKEQIASAALEQNWIAQAPVVIVVCADLNKIGRAYGERGTSLYSIQDASNATYGLMLAAWNRGLGTTWVGAFSEYEIRNILVLPSNIRPLAIVPIGVPVKIGKKPTRRPAEIHWEHW